MEHVFCSGDQNCSPFWDTWPKVEFLAKSGHNLLQIIHDTDILYRGHSRKNSYHIKWLHLKHDGSSYYSPNLFYYRFLGRHNPFPVDKLESYTGLKLSKISALLNLSIENLYEKFGAYDKLALLGGDSKKNGYRIAAGIKLSETYQSFEEFLDLIEEDMHEFVVTTDQKDNLIDVLNIWRAEVQAINEKNPNITISELFSLWMQSKFTKNVTFVGCSDYFRVIPENKNRFTFFLDFVRGYHEYAECYNKALEINNSVISKLDIFKGELPFYVIRNIEGQLLRFPIFLENGNLVIQDQILNLPLVTWEDLLSWCEEMRVECLIGKAIPLMMQLRDGNYGVPMVMPKLGSPYTAIVDSYSKLLGERFIGIKDVSLVDFQIFDALQKANFSFRLPLFLQEIFKKEIVHCKLFVEQLPFYIREANRVLDECKRNPQLTMREFYPSLTRNLADLEQKRTSQGLILAKIPKRTSEYQHEMVKYFEIKSSYSKIYREYVNKLCQLLVNQWHVSQLNYFNNRGAFELWSKTLGGINLYQSIIDHTILVSQK